MKDTLNNFCGIDVHQKNLVACVMYSQGSVTKKEIQTFGTTTPEIRELAKWLIGFRVSKVVIESTGIYWVPVFNLLEDTFELILANARNVKNVPGRKTDCKDCEWLCKLLKQGLIEKSFIPPEDIRDLRLLTRFRDGLIKDRTRYKNRIHKILECGNIKLSNVLTDCFGKTGWEIIKSLARGTDLHYILSHLPKNIKASKGQFEEALDGKINDCQRRLLQTLVKQIENLNQEIDELEKQILKLGEKFQTQIRSLISIPGVDEIAACAIIGEIGIDMKQFPTVQHLTSWACICPSSHESAGKKYSSHIRKGCNYLKSLLVQIAWAAAKTKTYLGEKYRRLAMKKGRKKALVALGRKILVIIYNLIVKKEVYYELGVDYLDNINMEKKKNYYMKQLKKLGCLVSLVEAN